MINLIEGQINIGEKNILATSDKDLSALAEEGLIEKRELDRGKSYYCMEDVAADIKLGVFIVMREQNIECLRLHWLHSPMKGWDDVSEQGVKDEFVFY